MRYRPVNESIKSPRKSDAKVVTGSKDPRTIESVHPERLKKGSIRLKFLSIFEKNACNVGESCLKANIGRTTFYNWYNQDEGFQIEIENIREGLLDYAESKLFKHIQDGNLTAVIFFLKTKGQIRGYIEKQYINTSSLTVMDEVVIE